MQHKNIIKTFAFFHFIFSFFPSAFAQTDPLEKGFSSALVNNAEEFLSIIVKFLDSILFYPIFGIPFLVLWLIIGGVFFTVRLGFVNIRMFGHAVEVVRGKYSKKDDPGEVSHFAALSAAVSATVGLGNIAGVAIAISLGGPGAVVWMAIAGFFGMSTKFAEVTLGQKYRTFDKNGKVSGGAFHYLRKGLTKKKLPTLGKVLAIVFAVFCIGGSLGGGNMFQANQSVKVLTYTYSNLKEIDLVIAMVLAVSVGVVLLGGIKRIAKVAEAIVPFMAFLYISSAIVVLVVNSEHLAEAFIIMFKSAFSGDAAFGGILGAIVNGFKRASFSNEAGIGSAPIAHAAARTKEPVREGCVALLEPFIDTVVICFLTGLVITVTGVYLNDVGVNGEELSKIKGVVLTVMAFETVAGWFSIVLSVAVVLFAYSTMITWSYYGERAWQYLFGAKSVRIFHIIFIFAIFFGGIIDLGVVIDFTDLLFLGMAIPNLFGLYILSGEIRKDTDKYIKKLKTGKFKKNPKGQML